MRVALAAETVRIAPGRPATLDVDVVNTSDVIDGLTASVLGFDAAWVHLLDPVVIDRPMWIGVQRP